MECTRVPPPSPLYHFSHTSHHTYKGCSQIIDDYVVMERHMGEISPACSRRLLVLCAEGLTFVVFVELCVAFKATYSSTKCPATKLTPLPT